MVENPGARAALHGPETEDDIVPGIEKEALWGCLPMSVPDARIQEKRRLWRMQSAGKTLRPTSGKDDLAADLEDSPWARESCA